MSAQDTNAQHFHSDAGSDVVGLLAVSQSGHGGVSTVANAARVYNHLAEHRPDIVRILGERRFRWKGYVVPNRCTRDLLTRVVRRGIPDDGVRLIHHKNGKLFLNFSTRPFIGYGEVCYLPVRAGEVTRAHHIRRSQSETPSMLPSPWMSVRPSADGNGPRTSSASGQSSRKATLSGTYSVRYHEPCR